ncbi:MAG: transposase [Verrucomicrobia bacterium]|nr:transposase [Verrucomicrobiota bacterium]
MKQPELIQPEHLPPRLRWEKLFQFLPQWPQPAARTGRRPVNRHNMLKACVYQRLTRKRFLRDLHTHLMENPPIAAALGFNPYQPPPSLERFSAFVCDCPHQSLQQICIDLTRALIQLGVINAKHVGFDSCPIASSVRENNLKTSLRRCRYDKSTPPKGDPDARLGVRIHYPNPGKTQVEYFWGYRNHTLVDLESELPLWEITEPNSVAETTLAVPLLESVRTTFDLKFESVSGDAEYDVEAILKHIVHTLQAKPFIPYNPRNKQDTTGFRRDGQKVFCPASLCMHRRGRMTVKGITYIQFSCPFFYGQKSDLLLCPAGHPKFTTQKGCNYLWRITNSIRDQIPYATEIFKEHYNRRTAIERVFSRLLAITIQEPSVRGLSSIRNHCTLSHIAVLLVALAAYKLGHADKVRFVRTFVPNFLD